MRNISYVIGFANGVDKFFPDLWGPSNPGGQESPISASRLLTGNYEARLFLFTLKLMQSKLADFSNVEELTDNQYKFMINGNPVYVLWGNNPPSGAITGNVRVTDIYGNSQTMNISLLTLSDNPVFVEMVTTAPTAPTLTSPSTGSADISTNPTLSWSASVGATTYRLQLATDSLFNSIVFNDSTLTTTSRQVGPLLNNTKYYWRVNAKNVAGTSAWTSIWNFTTIVSLPSAPTLLFPSNGSINQATSLTLMWNAVSGATIYHLQVSVDSGFTSLAVDDTNITSTSKQVTSLESNKKHFWRVRAKNAAGWGLYSSAWDFTTIVAAPAVPQLVSPTNGSIGASITPTLSWAASTGAVTYYLQVAADSLFNTIIFDDSTITSTSKQVGPLLNNTTYFWRVSAKNTGGTSPFSSTRSFTTIVAAPTAPTLASPADGAAGVSTSPTLTWNVSAGATTYRLQLSTDSTFASFIVNDSTLADTSKQVAPLASNTRYFWRVSAKNTGGTSPFSSTRRFTTAAPSAVEPVGSEAPTVFALSQNYPNPFSARGARLPDGQGSAFGGDARNLPSGLYVYRLTAGTFVQQKKMLVLR